MKKILFLLFAIASFYQSSAFGVSPKESFDEFITIYGKYGGRKYMIQEEIVQGSHILQAAYLAQLAGAPEEVIVGLLFHDVGQVAYEENIGDQRKLHADHAELGAVWLNDHGFPAFVCEWVENHALAKVVLCEEDPYYYQHLSKASKISYQIQKRKYCEEPGQYRLTFFRRHPRKEDFKAARKCDDMAKITGFNTAETGGSAGSKVLPGFEAYRAMTERVIAGEGHSETDPRWREQVERMYREMTENREAFENRIRTG